MSSENLNSFPQYNLEFEGMEISELDGELMMALLEESHIEEAEDERLGSVIRSLEAEINQPKGIHESFEYPIADFHSSFDWIDIEMASTSNDDDIGKWYTYSIENDILDMTEFGDNNDMALLSQTFGNIEDYSQLYYGDEHVFGSLWQGTYDPAM
ncbi:hypothetical protein IFM89_015181 [Coptis chinensis]|uniref:Uncharacterized protein n=1 Tax=Coptis chinensis TaxID=261450 RepID=A0A835LED7_9MAGN|nr:hypothetical protein IFM89_015181 [Coptis chinensis]